MRRLELLRGEFGRPMRLSSAYRCPAYDADIGGAGAHPTGHAVDVLIHGEAAFRLVALAVRRGFTGIGLHQRGPYAGRFVHLDDCPDERASGGARARPRIWTY